MTLAYVGIGGNIGDTEAHFQAAIRKIQLLEKVNSVHVSKFYRTTPVSAIPQNDYLNGALAIETTYTASKLLEHLLEIEAEMGKEKKEKDAPRIIDLDLLFYGEEVLNEETIQVPHPKWRERLFVLFPLSDLIEEILVPDSKGNIERVHLPTLIAQHKNPHNENIQELCYA